MPKSQLIWPIVIATLGVVFLGLVVWASASANFLESFSAIANDPWGVVSLFDLYLGFVLFAVIIAFADGWRAATVLWIVALCMLGNAVAVVWLLLRWQSLRARLSSLPKE